jgi:hypothetical protein
MIWIYENLTADESASLRQLEPFMDIGFDRDKSGGRIIYGTFCAGHEIKKGKIEEIRKVRFFGLDAVKQGFISDDIMDARTLCYDIKFHGQLEMFSDSTPNRRAILDYLGVKPAPWTKIIAVPVVTYMNHYKDEPSALDWLDLSSLKKWNIDIYDYIDIGKRWP